jgi:hypothetical protein
VLAAHHLPKLGTHLNWLTYWPACMRTIPCEEAALRRGARKRKRAG